MIVNQYLDITEQKKNVIHDPGVYLINLTYFDAFSYCVWLQILLEPEDGCRDAAEYDAIMVVHSAPGNYDKRKIFRQVYNNLNNTRPYRLKVHSY